MRNKANDWYDEHKADKYIKMEDDFFLPFIYEKLVDIVVVGQAQVLRNIELAEKRELDCLKKDREIGGHVLTGCCPNKI